MLTKEGVKACEDKLLFPSSSYYHGFPPPPSSPFFPRHSLFCFPNYKRSKISRSTNPSFPFFPLFSSPPLLVISSRLPFSIVRGTKLFIVHCFAFPFLLVFFISSFIIIFRPSFSCLSFSVTRKTEIYVPFSFFLSFLSSFFPLSFSRLFLSFSYFLVVIFSFSLFSSP